MYIEFENVMKLLISIIIDIMYNYAKSLIRKIICKNEYSSIKKKKKKNNEEGKSVKYNSTLKNLCLSNR